MLEEACRQTKEWQNRYPSGSTLIVCVDLSVRQFGQVGLAGEVDKALVETGLEASSLVLEIPESMLMDDARSSVDTLRKLKDLCPKVAVDGFWMLLREAATERSNSHLVGRELTSSEPASCRSAKDSSLRSPYN